MGAPFLAQLIGVRRVGGLPTIADGSSRASVEISQNILEVLGLQHNPAPEGQAAGALMETLVANDIRSELNARDPSRRWLVDRPGRTLSSYSQYEHLGLLQRIIEQDASKVLGIAIGREYEVAPDVTVAVDVAESAEGGPGTLPGPLLHASISCKLTIRSDRVQNIRQESAILIRHRRGRLPHIVAVTLEPLPSRLASIARGTGDVDAVYHPALDELAAAVAPFPAQREIMDELVGQKRLLSYAGLARTLTTG
jgi:hypothetical protein